MKHSVAPWICAVIVAIIPSPHKVHAQTNAELSAINKRGDLQRMEEIASTGDVRAEVWLGRMLQRRGRDEEAKTWWRKAAAKSDLSAIDMLGSMLLRENQDDEAASWYRRGAVAGSASAQQKYASLLLAGRGVAANESEAVRWLEAAADQQSVYAYEILAGLYEAGRGTDRDLVEAYALAAIAEVTLDDSESGYATGRRARLEKQLSSDEVEDAMQRARARFPQYDERATNQMLQSLFPLMFAFAFLTFLAAIILAINKIMGGVYLLIFGRKPNTDFF